MRKMIRRKQLREYLPLGETQIAWHEAHDPAFPKSVLLTSTGRARGYFVDEVEEYLKLIAQNKTPRR
jgi:hypothetical protein